MGTVASASTLTPISRYVVAPLRRMSKRTGRAISYNMAMEFSVEPSVAKWLQNLQQFILSKVIANGAMNLVTKIIYLKTGLKLATTKFVVISIIVPKYKILIIKVVFCFCFQYTENYID